MNPNGPLQPPLHPQGRPADGRLRRPSSAGTATAKGERQTNMSGEPQNPPLARWLEKTTAILALLGLFLYGILRVNYSIFYGNLGLTPEVMGLGYADLLTQSLAGLALIAVGLLLFMVIFFVRVIAWGLYETKSEAGKEA